MTLACWRFTALFAFVAGLATVPAQQQGSLTGKIIYMSGGHGWTFSGSSWSTQRGETHEMIEDFGNLDQMNFFAAYCLSAGATVVPFRPLGYQTNEVIINNPQATFVGAWSDSSATSSFYGGAGEVPYRFASLAPTETATAHYIPDLPKADFYPVYAWASHGGNRSRQLYRIRHTGGEAAARVPHDMVGSGWIYLGTYHFDAGTNGGVIISNLREPGASGSVVIADAIRFGNGIGPSGYPREDEASRYWVQAGLGVGDPTSIYNTGGSDNSDNVGTPPRMGAHMNREQAGSRYERVFVSFHSNAGGGRGTVALHNGNHPGEFTTNQFRLAQLIGQEVNNDLVALPGLETPWHDRGTAVTLSRSDIAFGEINNIYIDDEFDATILEVAFHDDPDDALLLRDPKARRAVARATYQGLIRYLNQFSAVPLVFLPEPPSSPRAAGQPDGRILLQWNAPGTGGGSPSGYMVQISTNGYGFAPFAGSAGLSVMLSNLVPETDWFFRIHSTNSAGISLPSEVIACRNSAFGAARVLYVNAFDRFDRLLSPRQTAGSAMFDRCQPRRMNSFDYVIQHAQALGRNGVAYDSCQNEAIGNGQVRLTNYAAAIWAAGLESTADETFSATEQTRVAEFLDRGGKLFVSGAEIAWDLDRQSGPTAADRAFLHNYLRAALGNDTNDDAGTYNFSALPTGVFSANPAARFDDGTFGTYNVQYPDRLTPTGGAISAMAYAGGTASAAVQHDNRLIYFGFPFETITTASAREAYMLDVLKYFDILPRPVILAYDRATATVMWRAIPGKRYRVQFKNNLALANWISVPGDVTAAGHLATKVDIVAPTSLRFYRVFLVEP